MVRKLFLSCLFSLQKNFLLYLLVLVGDLFMEWSPDGEHKAHCTKKRISQVLKDHGKLKRPSKHYLYINFLAKKKYFPSPKSSKQELFGSPKLLTFQ